MVMVTFTGDSLEKNSASLDTLKSDIDEGLVGGVTYFVWSNNLQTPAQITHLSKQLQQRSSIPLLIATDQEGGRVARLGKNNGFAVTKTAYQLGTILNQESKTREQSSTMAGWLSQCGINTNFAPVADVNVNPKSPAIGALERSFSAHADSVTLHAEWFCDEMHKKNIFTAVKHFPGHGSAATDSHLGFTDITSTWSNNELIPFQSLINQHSADMVMMGHLFNRNIDSVYPASLSSEAIISLLRNQLGFNGVVITDAMSMKAITDNFGFSESIVLAVNAGVDLLLYTTNLDSLNRSLARTIVSLIEQKVNDGAISITRINDAYQHIMTLKNKLNTTYVQTSPQHIPENFSVGSYPNPFNGIVTMQFILPQKMFVDVTVYDMLGRKVEQLFHEEAPSGKNYLRWNAQQYPSGIYFAQFQTPYKVFTQKLVYVK